MVASELLLDLIHLEIGRHHQPELKGKPLVESAKMSGHQIGGDWTNHSISDFLREGSVSERSEKDKSRLKMSANGGLTTF
jgi:hypothetical protein